MKKKIAVVLLAVCFALAMPCLCALADESVAVTETMLTAPLPVSSLVMPDGQDIALIAAPEPADFSDIDIADENYAGIAYCVKNGIMNGIGGGLFNADGIASRAMIVTMLYRLAGEPAFMNDNVFEDVPAGSYYEKAVVWADGKNIVTGHSNGLFAPDAPITREQLVAILYRFAEYMEYDVSIGENTNILSYEDVFDIASWAWAAVQWSCGSGVLSGDEETGCWYPRTFVSRGEAASVFKKASIAWGIAEEDPGMIVGGWNENMDFAAAELAENEAAVFAAATSGLLGVRYTPVALLATQVVAGRNYSFLCKERVMNAEGTTSLCIITAYQDLQGNVEFTGFKEIKLSDYLAASEDGFPEAGLAGGWNVAGEFNAALPENVQAAFDKATGAMVGVKYTPIAFLGSQVVSGSNYAVLCSLTTVTAQPVSKLAVVVIYNALDGSAEIKSVCSFPTH